MDEIADTTPKVGESPKVEITLEQLTAILRQQITDIVREVVHEEFEKIREDFSPDIQYAAKTGAFNDLPKLDIPVFSVGAWPEDWNDVTRESLYGD